MTATLRGCQVHDRDLVLCACVNVRTCEVTSRLGRLVWASRARCRYGCSDSRARLHPAEVVSEPLLQTAVDEWLMRCSSTRSTTTMADRHMMRAHMVGTALGDALGSVRQVHWAAESKCYARSGIGAYTWSLFPSSSGGTPRSGSAAHGKILMERAAGRTWADEANGRTGRFKMIGARDNPFKLY